VSSVTESRDPLRRSVGFPLRHGAS
jgi:hypothetical protein